MNYIFLALVCMLCYGAFDYLIATPARKISSFHLLLSFSFFNSLFLLFLIFLFGSQIGINYFLIFPILTGIFGHLGVFLYSRSLFFGKIGISSSITNAYPFIAVLLGYVFLGEYLTIAQWIFFIFVLVGIIFSSFHVSEISKFKIDRDKKSIYYSLGAMLSYGFFVYFFDRSVEYFDPLYAAFISELFIFGGLIIFFLGKNKGILQKFEDIDKKILYRIALISILGMIGYVSLGAAFSIGSLALVSAIAACSPVVTTILARVLGNEKLEIIQYLAIGILVFGIAGLSYFSI